MKFLCLIVLVGTIGYVSFDKFNAQTGSGLEPLHESSYVVVYGRDTCGITNRMLADLDRSGVPYEYKRVGDSRVSNELHTRMETAGLSTRRYGLPVVDVNAEMIIRPEANAVAEKYRQFARASKLRAAARGSATTGKAGAPTQRDAVAATQHLADPLVKCTVDGQQTYMLQSQCPR